MKEQIEEEFDYSVFIGRFEPPHLGHLHVIKKAFEVSKKVIILVGSKNRARSIKNPWIATERFEMIDAAINELMPEYKNSYVLKSINDYSYNNNQWAQEIQRAVSEVIYQPIVQGVFYPKPKVCLIGHRKDSSSFYLDLFPQWTVKEISSCGTLNASDLRKLYFEKSDQEFYDIAKKVIPISVLNILLYWKEHVCYQDLLEEYKKIKSYKESWQFAPFPPTFIAADAVVIESGHILLIKRGGSPGKGTWALPGGFLNQNETLEDCCLRELVEETNIGFSIHDLRKFIRKSEVFDSPERDLRGRMITKAFLIELPGRFGSLTKVKAADDACEAKWIPLYYFEEMRNNGLIFADHSDIVYKLLGQI